MDIHQNRTQLHQPMAPPVRKLTNLPAALCPASFVHMSGIMAEWNGPQTPGTKCASVLVCNENQIASVHEYRDREWNSWTRITNQFIFLFYDHRQFLKHAVEVTYRQVIRATQKVRNKYSGLRLIKIRLINPIAFWDQFDLERIFLYCFYIKELRIIRPRHRLLKPLGRRLHLREAGPDCFP